MRYAIQTTGLRKQFGEKCAVNDLELKVPAGDVFGFLGPNGSGKTTTIRTIVGLLEPTAGTVTVCGDSVTTGTDTLQEVGYAPATPALYDHLTAREHLRYATEFRGLSESEATDRIEHLLDVFEFEDAADDRVTTYSTGMKQKTNLMQACVHDPDLLILDEPTSGLDPHAVRTLKNFVSEYTGKGRTVFLSTHVLSIVEEVADTIAILSDGTLRFQGAPDELTEFETLESAFIDLTSDSQYA